ncbi:hypothetical protein L6164_030110 [Bauhinia variegata]|uniref:Uncharacterized protein n=1 Tax=Bauhinia variegata TaxID=167791 RepID=A0ACB9LCM0_BAUVA|nr:hypothetical protein L6164_030110 [Bauhinia variegata]
MRYSLCVLLLLFSVARTISPFSHSDRYTRSDHLLRRRPQEYFEVTHPLPSGHAIPSCSHQILRHSFGNTINSPPFSTSYSPPSRCPAPWSRVILHFHATCKGEQYDRIAGLWLGGVELLRTSTAQPTQSGIFWDVRKDVTRYSSLLVRSDLKLTMMLENIVNREFTGVYHVTITLLYFKGHAVGVPFRVCSQGQGLNLNRNGSLRILKDESGSDSETPDGISQVGEEKGESNVRQGSFYMSESPADLIIPISDEGNRGFWFRIESDLDLHSKRIQIPPNTYRAVLELYVSYHGNDEFWYSNPPNSYIKTNNLDTGRGNGAYREVYVAIDGEIVGSEIPFPVIFTGGVNPLFWEPMVAIGAFNLPSYDLDLTPFLGKLLDGKKHNFAIGVTQGISYWFVNANLHLWLDPHSSEVHAHRIVHHGPELTLERQEEFIGLDGTFEIEAERQTQSAGWVSSSSGNITTIISQGVKLKNRISFRQNGTYKLVKQHFKVKKRIKIINGRGELITQLKVKKKYPLRVITSMQPSLHKDRYILVTNVSHALKERYSDSGGCFRNSISNNQNSMGWMEVKDHSVLSGQAFTRQNYTFHDKLDCYSRNVAAANGRIVEDISSFACQP